MLKHHLLLALALTLVLTSQIAPSTAQQILLTSVYSHILVDRATTLYIPVNVTNLGPATKAAFRIDAPKGWDTALTYKGYNVKELNIQSGQSVELSLKVSVPADASRGNNTVSVVAYSIQGVAATLDLTVEYAAPPVPPPGVSLTTVYPTLSGPSGTNFEFTVNVKNTGGEDDTFTLISNPPAGWTVTFRPQFETSQITSLSLKAGESKTITVSVNPPPKTDSGIYNITLTAASSKTEGSVKLAVEITGTYSLSLTTVDERLSAEAVAGEETYLTLIAKNTGTSALRDVSISSNHPSGWSVTFEPALIPSLAPEASQQISVKVKPSSTTLPGDYMVTFSAYGSRVSKTVEIRVTVTSPPGLTALGLAVVAAVAVALALIFLRFGRR
ncbi:MAG: NEW3 domain-containing protein [Nitrososphaerales archaeon]